MLYFAGPAGDCCIILEPRLNEKPRDVHLYCTPMALRGLRTSSEKVDAVVLNMDFVE